MERKLPLSVSSRKKQKCSPNFGNSRNVYKSGIDAMYQQASSCTPTALVRTVPETFKGLGLSQQDYYVALFLLLSISCDLIMMFM